jgi:hypothetical protein
MKTIRVKIEHLCFSSWLATLIALLQAKQILRSSPLIRASIGCGTSLASRYSILDFSHADGDHIDLSVIDANSSKSGNQLSISPKATISPRVSPPITAATARRNGTG